MNILPQQLIGKTVKDCYFSDKYKVIIEFTDGTKIQIESEEMTIQGRPYLTEGFIRVIV